MTGTGKAVPPLLRATGISKVFGPVRALSAVDLCVNRGEVVALCGENGSGKSTLSRVLCGVLRPDAGVVKLDGRAVSFARPRDALDAGVAMVSQEPTAVPALSVAENVLLPRLQRPLSRVRRRDLCEQALPHLRRVGLVDLDPMTPLGAVRSGDRELVEIAKALSAEPSVLVLDEVTTRLPDTDHLFRVVDDLAAGGMAVVVITHRLREVRRLANRAVVLRDGQRVAELGRDEMTDERLSAAMVGRPLATLYDRQPVPVLEPVLVLDGVVTDRSPHPVTLTVRRGEVVGVAGLVGSGRSELLETVAGARRPRAGTVHVAGRRLRAGSPADAIAAGVALVPEDRFGQALVRAHSLQANLNLPFHRLRSRTSRATEHRRAATAVRDVGIRAAGVGAPVASLSGGNAQKVVIARCLEQRPAVLLLDEPTRGVDIGAKAEIYQLVQRFVQDGLGVLLASSDLPELLGLCDRIVVLHDGEVAGELDRQQATEEAVALLSAGGGRRAS